MIQKADAAVQSEIDDLVKSGKIPPEAAAQLSELLQKNASVDDYAKALQKMVAEGKISPEVAAKLLESYKKNQKLKETAAKLGVLQGNNASPQAYADALKQAVAAGIITPEQAAQMMQEYQAALAKGTISVPGAEGEGATTAFSDLQRRVQAGATTPTEEVASEFAEAETEAETESDQDRQARIAALSGAMSSQAQELISAWQAPSMEHRGGSASTVSQPGKEEGASEKNTKNGKGLLSNGAAQVLIKAGTVLFAVLDTEVNSDYPDSPVMATIVLGKHKGAKLLGKLVTTKGVSGQMDRVMLNFTLMNMEDWPASQTISAYAVDPDKARTVIASEVDYHYMQRFGSMMATSFLQGYGSAVMASGGQISTSLSGTNQTNPALDPKQKLAVALGQMGQALGSATQNYVNRPPTVKVDSGVGIGILFMTDATIS